MTKDLFFVIGLLLIALSSDAQNVKRPESYNYQRGLEALQEEKYQEALDYFNKDLLKTQRMAIPTHGELIFDL